MIVTKIQLQLTIHFFVKYESGVRSQMRVDK